MGTQPPLPKKWAEPLIFGPCLLRPNGCMDQDATWYGGRPGDFLLDGDPASLPKKGAYPPPQFSAHVHSSSSSQVFLKWPKQRRHHEDHHCGQMAGWIKMALGTEVGLDPRQIVLDGEPAPLPKKGPSRPNFRPIFIVTKRLDASRCHLVWR